MPDILQGIPDLPAEEKVEKIKKNWWIYLLFPVCIALTTWVNNYVHSLEMKPCNDEVLYLTRKLDSTDRDNMNYMRELLQNNKK
jgi:hypothetical protein